MTLARKIGTIVFLGAVALVISLYSATRSRQEPPTTSAAVAESDSLAFADIRTALGDGRSDEDFSIRARQFEGRNVRWTGYVEDIIPLPAGGHELQVDMDAPGADGGAEVLVEIPASLAAALAKDARVELSGMIAITDRVAGLWFVRLNDASVSQ